MRLGAASCGAARAWLLQPKDYGVAGLLVDTGQSLRSLCKPAWQAVLEIPFTLCPLADEGLSLQNISLNEMVMLQLQSPRKPGLAFHPTLLPGVGSSPPRCHGHPDTS